MSRFANKIVVIYLILPVIFSGIFFIYTVYAGTLACTVRDTACVGDEVDIFEMQAITNSHAGTTASSYTKLVCCGGVSGLGTSCSGTFDTVLKLSGTTNAHAQQTGAYLNTVCMSVTGGGSVNIDYQATNCSTFDTTLASMSDTTNAHVGDTTAYTTKICGTAAAGGAQTLSFSLGNTLALGTLSSSAVTTGSHTMNVATNASSGIAVTISGTTLTSGGNTISACAANCTNAGGAGQGTEQFGINLKDNASPNVGLEASGTPPIGAAAANYATVDSFRFVTGDTIASSAGAINDTTFTISYIANISGATEAGSYNSTLTYIATATF